MKVEDICKVEVNWMEQYANDPHVTFVLKRDRKIKPWADFRWRQYGNLFVSECENEVHFVAHSRNDHNGFGGAMYSLHMADDWLPIDWRDCGTTQPRWNSGGGSHDVRCYFEQESRVLYIKGPWSSGPVAVKRLAGIECVSVATLEGPSRLSISNPKYYQRMQRQGRAWSGTPFSTHYTLDFARDVIDRLAPHIELWEGDYGWTVKLRDMEPKNPRKRGIPVGDVFMSDEQSAVVFS